MLDQLVSCGARCPRPVGNHPITANSPGRGLKQTAEISPGLEREPLSNLLRRQGFIGNALVIHHPTCTRDRTFDRLLIPAFAVEEQAVGLAQDFA